jgi:signal transduction histidine kinase
MLRSTRSVVALTLVMAVVFAVSGWVTHGVDRDGIWLELALIAANTLPLLLLPRNPLIVVLVLAVTYPVWVSTGHGAHLLQSLPTLAALFYLGTWDRPLWLRAVGLASPVWMMSSSIAGWWDVDDPLEIGYVAVVFVTVWVLGVLIAARRDHVAELERKTAALEAAERQLADRAVADERARIARELHDVVAHAMSVITVQAGVGAHLIDTRPEQAAEALGAIERTGREALSEMRRMLSVLQGPDGPRTDPQPGLSDLAHLAEQMRNAGMAIRVETEGPARPLSPGLDLAAYRVVQEGLTNVVKHTPGARAEVAVRYRPEVVEVEVRSHGADVGRPVVVGQGLKGMAERVALYDGALDFGPEADGFRVAARFPTGTPA